VLNSLLSPLRTGVLLAVLLALAWRWLPRWLRRLAWLPLLACLALSLPLVANSMVRYQESRVPAARICTSPLPGDIVVISGGSVRRPVSPADFGALGESSLRRTMAAVALWRQDGNSRLWISGGAGHYPVAESVLMAELAGRMGVPAASIDVETASRSTWQNAQFVRAGMAGTDRRIALVTSSLHMPRALYAFEQAGFDVCTWPADSRYARANSLGYFLPSTTALDKSEAVIHEWAGEFAYRRGWLRSLTRDPWKDGDEQ
jgi:uncharacterized SAM-binding protein YcdF (DUF218 family)